MGSSRKLLSAVFLSLVCSCLLRADDNANTPWLKVDFPGDSPLGVISYSLGNSTASVRGISLALNLHTSLTLRNASNKRIRGLTLLVEAQDLTPSGKASVTAPTIDAAPGEIFPVRLDLELLRPFNAARSGGALVEVSIDCVLFDDLTSYGPDRVHSKRSLMVYELEGRRDRNYFRSLVESGQFAKLQQEMDFGLPDLRDPQLGFELLNDIRLNTRPSRSISVAFVPFPDSPLQMLNGAARVYRNEVQMPEVDLRNRSQKTTQSVEVGWILHDDRGRDYMAGSLPTVVAIGPVQQARIQQSGIMRFSHVSGGPVLVHGVSAFISNVEFTDGNLWIPSRSDITNADVDPGLKHAMSSSPEQQRLAEIYRRKGMTALASELAKSKD
jgi:hypothetical protein